MEYSKTSEWIDILAPREEVFRLIVDIDRRMQLSPLWGIASVEARPAEYPQVGSAYLVRHKSPPPAEAEPAPPSELVAVAPPENEPAPEPLVYTSVVTAYEPPYRLSYCLDVDQQTSVTWHLNEIASGTRLTYSEEYLVDPTQAEEFNTAVRDIVKNWLRNIKNYAELRDSRFKRLIRWGLDRFYLKMGPDQRKVVAVILFMHFTGLIAFVMAAIAMGIGSLLF